MPVQGECRLGQIVCVDGGEQCEGEVLPVDEACGNGKDDDCDGDTDEDCACTPDATQTCGSTDVGLCTFGTQTCMANSTWGACDAVMSTAEMCDGDDNDCDGTDDNGFDCVRGSSGFACTTSCGSQGTGSCDNSCAVSCAPPSETCNGADDDCDGVVDEGVATFGTQTTIAGQSGFSTAIVPASDGFVVLYDQKLQKIDSAGNPVSGTVSIDEPTTTFERAALTRLRDGRVVVARAYFATEGVHAESIVTEVSLITVGSTDIGLGSWVHVGSDEEQGAPGDIAIAPLADGGAVIAALGGFLGAGALRGYRITSSLSRAVGPVTLIPVNRIQTGMALVGTAAVSDPVIVAADTNFGGRVYQFDSQTLTSIRTLELGVNIEHPSLSYDEEAREVSLTYVNTTPVVEFSVFDPVSLACSGGGTLGSCGTVLSTVDAGATSVVASGGRWIVGWAGAGTGLGVRVLDPANAILASLNESSFTAPAVVSAAGTNGNVVHFGEKSTHLSAVPLGCF